MLEVVGIEITGFYNFVWLYIIIEYCYLKIISLFCKERFCLFKDFCMWCCACCNLNWCQITVGCCCLTCCLCTSCFCACFCLSCCAALWVG